MATYEKQPDALPTNKATAASSIATIVALNAEPVMAELWPYFAPALLAGPAVTSALAAVFGIFVGLAVAWWVPDRAGVPA